MKPGRNDPCPCGSGKKYKQCCLPNEAAPPIELPALSAQHKAHAYLKDRFRSQQREVTAEEFFGQFDDPDALSEALEALGEGHQRMLAVALDDWLLCEADYERRGDCKRGIDWVLADAQVRLTDVERTILAAMALAPLHLYEIGQVERGRGFFLRDLHEVGAPARFIHEDSASRNAREGHVLGVRVIEDPDRKLRISGVVYLFSRTQALDLLEEIRFALLPVDDEEEPPSPLPTKVLDTMIADYIREQWLGSLLAPELPPDLVTRDGEPMLIIEDEYEVLDQAALEAALDAQSDVAGDTEDGWIRLLPTTDDGDDMASVLSSIYLGEDPGTVVLFHRSASAAELGREWFARIAGKALCHRERRETDPMEMLARRDASVQAPASKLPEGIAPEEFSAVIASAIRSTYAGWCDAPLPILSGTTPREMLATREDRERLRFLLRTYELGEREMAAEQERPPVSYDFLWEELGLGREEPSGNQPA